MNLVNPYIFAAPVDLSTNTEIGGAGVDLTTKESLATRLGISSSRISNFSIISNNIKCKITGNYELPNGAFSFKNCTYYYDNDSLVTRLNSYVFDQCLGTGFTSFKFDGVTSVGARLFQFAPIEIISFPNLLTCENVAFAVNLINLKTVSLPKITSLGSSSGENSVFYNCGTLAKTLTLPIFFKTNNGGNPDGDVVYFNSRNGVTTYL